MGNRLYLPFLFLTPNTKSAIGNILVTEPLAVVNQPLIRVNKITVIPRHLRLYPPNPHVLLCHTVLRFTIIFQNLCQISFENIQPFKSQTWEEVIITPCKWQVIKNLCFKIDQMSEIWFLKNSKVCLTAHWNELSTSVNSFRIWVLKWHLQVRIQSQLLLGTWSFKLYVELCLTTLYICWRWHTTLLINTSGLD